MHKILVIGGAGYIGSHIVSDLCELNHKVTVFDNFSTGFSENVDNRAQIVQGDILNDVDLKKVFKNSFDVVYHFAGLKAARDSMINPITFNEVNITGSNNIIKYVVNHNIKYFIFSSSAAVYGQPLYLPLDERHKLNPINYYGFTKLYVENLLSWHSKINNIHIACLRYFNAAGYDVKNRINKVEEKPNNFLPILMEAATGKRKAIEVYGGDYNTSDGSCVRDYIHVNDLSQAHIMSMDYIISERKNIIANLSTGKGCSVLEIIKAFERFSKIKIKYDIVDRKEGDPPSLYAVAKNAKQKLNWQPVYSNLETILSSMWQVYKRGKNDDS